MGKYKLTYFNFRGFAEVSRLILIVKGEDFDDIRIEREKWPEMKTKTPQGKLPMLEMDGKIIVQSSAICRRLASEFGMYGDDVEEATSIDTVLGSIDDFWPPMTQIIQGATEEVKNTATKKIEDDIIPGVFNYFTEMIKNNKHGFLVGNRLSLADLAFFAAVEQVEIKFPDFMEKYPEMTAHRKKIADIPEIKDWLTKRPVTEF